MTLMGLSDRAAADDEGAIAGIAEPLEVHECVCQFHKDALDLTRSNTPDEGLYLRSQRRLPDRMRFPTSWRIFEAGEQGCLLLDFFTHFRPEARSYELDWGAAPVDAE